MPISLLTNLDSLTALENLNTNNAAQSQTIDRLSSGFRITSASDDPAGLALANRYRSDTGELNQGVENLNNGIAQLQIMDGGLNNIANILDRLKTLATQSASQTFSGDRKMLNSEFQALIGEINRQAQSIGLDRFGQYAQPVSIYVGGSAGTSITVDLSASAVDSQSLGLKIPGATGLLALGSADIGSGSSTHSVEQILADPGNITPTPGYTTFCFAGPGFSGGSQIAVPVNLQGVSSLNSLVAAINAAIQIAGAGPSAQAAAFQSSNIIASVYTDSGGGQELSFQSPTAAFQVEAGDRLANAFLGNLNGTTGKALATTVQGLGPAAGPAGQTAAAVAVRISGASLSTPADLTLPAGSTTTDLAKLVNGAPQLSNAGISASADAATGALTFTDVRGETFTVQATGDRGNVLGLGTFVSGPGAKADYTTIQGTYDNTTASGFAHLEFSFNGAPSIVIPPIDLSGGDASGGNSRTIDDLASALNTDFATIPGLKQAGLVATCSGTALTISSNNHTYFRLNPAGSDPTADLGFGVTGCPFVASLSSGAATDLPLASIGAGGVGPFSFSPIAFGGDTQSLTVSAVDDTGAQHAQLIDLRNDDQGRQGADIDSAIAYINSQLQGDATLAHIVAVKADTSGAGSIQFLSRLPSFTVAVGASINGDGVNAGSPALQDSSLLGGSTMVAIDTQAGAMQALTAIAGAVTTIGNTQAVVGKGENQLNYALNLSQSEITNFSSAESQIRDADMAAEAANLTRTQVLQQATMAALAQANVSSQAVLTLLKS